MSKIDKLSDSDIEKIKLEFKESTKSLKKYDIMDV